MQDRVYEVVRPMTEFVQVSTAVDSKERANKIARRLLDERVSSWVQVLDPIQSKYWWKGRIERAREWICFIEARADDYWRILAVIKNVHRYDVPVITAFPVLCGNAYY